MDTHPITRSYILCEKQLHRLIPSPYLWLRCLLFTTNHLLLTTEQLRRAQRVTDFPLEKLSDRIRPAEELPDLSTAFQTLLGLDLIRF